VTVRINTACWDACTVIKGNAKSARSHCCSGLAPDRGISDLGAKDEPPENQKDGRQSDQSVLEFFAKKTEIYE
jgi:hypothetical protein